MRRSSEEEGMLSWMATNIPKKHKNSDYKVSCKTSDLEIEGSFDSRDEFYRYQIWHDGALLLTHTAKEEQTKQQCITALDKFFSREE